MAHILFSLSSNCKVDVWLSLKSHLIRHIQTPISCRCVLLATTSWYIVTLIADSKTQSHSWEADGTSSEQDIPRSLWVPTTYSKARKSPSLVPIMINKNFVNYLFYFFNIHWILCFHLFTGLPKGSLPFTLPEQNVSCVHPYRMGAL
jgi:hypothetical protein